GVYSTFDASGALDLYGLLYTQRGTVGVVETAWQADLITLGGRWVSSTDAVSWRLEAAYQLGETEFGAVTTDRRAFL
ncbi:MAG: hypothetical protein GWN71_39580, partial [Gammaproteobacteria bacterium]|nr:hypothetical protein [Gemmatimonadota bacterium]NIU79432.1 hypothetical protein [Gammaproteobacteria bacterium]